jgi:hypothetical protein
VCPPGRSCCGNAALPGVNRLAHAMSWSILEYPGFTSASSSRRAHLKSYIGVKSERNNTPSRPQIWNLCDSRPKKRLPVDGRRARNGRTGTTLRQLREGTTIPPTVLLRQQHCLPAGELLQVPLVPLTANHIWCSGHPITYVDAALP